MATAGASAAGATHEGSQLDRLDRLPGVDDRRARDGGGLGVRCARSRPSPTSPPLPSSTQPSPPPSTPLSSSVKPPSSAVIGGGAVRDKSPGAASVAAAGGESRSSLLSREGSTPAASSRAGALVVDPISQARGGRGVGRGRGGREWGGVGRAEGKATKTFGDGTTVSARAAAQAHRSDSLSHDAQMGASSS